MARIRSVHPDICQSDTMAALSAGLERTFVRLWTHCDDEGRCEDRPRIIKAGIYPAHDEMTWQRLDAELDELSEAGLVIRYEADGKRYLAVRSWDEYQHPQRPRPSKCPTPPSHDGDMPDSSANGNGHLTDASLPSHEPSAITRVHVADDARTGGGVGEGGEEGAGVGGVSRVVVTPEAERLSHLLADSIGQRGSKRPNVTDGWVTDMDKLIRIDGREADDVARVIRWLNDGRDEVAQFWQANVRSPRKLREKWDQMREQYERRKRGTSREQNTDQAWSDSQALLRAVPDGVNPIDMMLRGAG